MATPTVKNKNITTNEFSRMVKPHENDLTALFQVSVDEIESIMEKSFKDGKTVDQMLNEIDELFQEYE